MQLRVLVVDDEPLAREGLKLLLGRQPGVGFVSEARNGREAIAIIRERPPDLVLLDVQMPRMDGFAVVHAVGAERMPAVIFVTAFDEYAVRADALVGRLQDGLGEAVSVAHPDGGLFAWVRLHRVDADALAARLADRGILVNPGSQFSPRDADATHVAPHLRITFARHDADTLRRVADEVALAHRALEGSPL